VAGVEKRDFDSPDESRTPDKTRVDVVRMGGTTAARFTMEPGWRWSDCVKPVAGTDSCQHRHVGVVQSGRMRDYTRGHEILDAMPAGDTPGRRAAVTRYDVAVRMTP
jgi:hypothetical protein